MKKLFACVIAGALVAGTAMAQSSMGTLNAGAIGLNATASDFTGLAAGSGPFSTNNDDTCDIAVTPAATLLLPNFDVDFNATRANATDTFFTITNTSRLPQVAHITIWTDRSFPIIDFNVFLTGYDVQSLSVYDILRGEIAPLPSGASGGTSATTTPGSRSALNNANPNHAAGIVGACTALPGNIPQPLLGEVQSALTTGVYFGTAGVGNAHDNAIGYITIDVANTCSQTLPTSSDYFSTEILYDNVLIGDYQRVDPRAGGYAGGSPMVHIRAIPEGGPAGLPAGGASVLFPYTFYDRYTSHVSAALAKADRRQPLPGTFAARYLNTPFNTNFAIWREGTVATGNVAPNASIPLVEIVRFDERENPTVSVGGGCQISPCPVIVGRTLPETSRPEVLIGGTTPNTLFPAPSASGDAGGWMYMNLNNNSGAAAYSDPRRAGGSHAGVSQNWVIVQMTAEGRYGVDFDAAFLGSGCSVNPGVTSGANPIGPAANVTPVGAGAAD